MRAKKLPEIAVYVEGGIVQDLLIVDRRKPREKWRSVDNYTLIDFDVDNYTLIDFDVEGADTSEICTGCKYASDAHYENCGEAKP